MPAHCRGIRHAMECACAGNMGRCGCSAGRRTHLDCAVALSIICQHPPVPHALRNRGKRTQGRFKVCCRAGRLQTSSCNLQSVAAAPEAHPAGRHQHRPRIAYSLAEVAHTHLEAFEDAQALNWVNQQLVKLVGRQRHPCHHAERAPASAGQWGDVVNKRARPGHAMWESRSKTLACYTAQAKLQKLKASACSHAAFLRFLHCDMHVAIACRAREGPAMGMEWWAAEQHGAAWAEGHGITAAPSRRSCTAT